MAVIDDVRALGSELERSYPVYVHGRLKFRVKQIVYVAFSRDERVMGFGFPKEEREALVRGDAQGLGDPLVSFARGGIPAGNTLGQRRRVPRNSVERPQCAG